MRMLWDLDGTICDTYISFVKVFRLLMKEYGVPMIYNDEELHDLLKKSVSIAIMHAGLPKESFQRFQTLESQVDPSEKPLFDGVMECLQKTDCNVLVTHKSKESTVAILNHYGIAHYFQEIITSDDGFPRKPSTDAYAYLHQKYQLTHAIGDRDIDLIPAKKIGLKTISFQNNNIECDLRIKSYDQIVTNMD